MRTTSTGLLAILLLLAAGSAYALDAEDRQKAREELSGLSKQIGVLSRCFNLVHEVVAPSVVSIHTREQLTNAFPLSGRVATREVEVGEGSGFVVRSDDKESWILTNAHVVLQTNHEQEFVRGRNNQPVTYDRLVVQLTDSRDVEAEYVGVDLSTDLAVIKVAVPKLPAIDWGDSDQVHVGDWVLALGYPLGVGYSATSGIVSATDRSTGIYEAMQGLESFIQTDAAINPGNSGGPLVSIDGRIIGVNSNILSRTGANIGIGFAIPANLARHVADDLLAFGRVRWPGIGVDLRELTADQARELGLPPAPAVIIARVLAKSPASEGGLQRNDVVMAINRTRVQTSMNFRARVAGCRIGEAMTMRVWRAGKEVEQQIVPIDRDEILKQRANEEDVELKGFGLRVGVDDGPGLVVTEVDPDAPGGLAGIALGDRLLQERSLRDLRTPEDALALGKRREVILQVLRDGRAFWVRMRR
jgi:S1-C subfamily serine protease